MRVFFLIFLLLSYGGINMVVKTNMRSEFAEKLINALCQAGMEEQVQVRLGVLENSIDLSLVGVPFRMAEAYEKTLRDICNEVHEELQSELSDLEYEVFSIYGKV